MATSSVALDRTAGGNAGGGGTTAQGSASTTATALIAPIIEPPAAFCIVAPGIYRCSASSLTQGLPAALSRHARKDKLASGSSSSSASGSANGSNSSTTAQAPATAVPTTPTESFLSSLQLKTIVLLAPEKKPTSLASWCADNHIKLIHLGLGALADREETGNGNEAGELHANGTDLFLSTTHKSLELYDGLLDLGILSLERIVKDSLEILLHRDRLPCLICDTSGVNETGVVVGCLRRLQRRNFASIRYEVNARQSALALPGPAADFFLSFSQYRTFAGNRSRSSHERFIEVGSSLST